MITKQKLQGVEVMVDSLYDKELSFSFESFINNEEVYREIENRATSITDLENAFMLSRLKNVKSDNSTSFKAIYKSTAKNILKTNVKKCKDEKYNLSREYFLRTYIENPAFYGVHLMKFNDLSFVSKYLEVEGIENVNKVFNQFGKVIFNPLHIDVFQLLPFYISKKYTSEKFVLFGPELSLVPVKKIHDLYHDNIENLEYQYIDNVEDSPYLLVPKLGIKHLNDNKSLYILPEVSFGTGPKNTTRFLGHSVNLPLGSSYISHKTGVPIIPTYIRRDKGSKMVLKFEDPIYPKKELCRDNYVRQAKMVFEKIEKIVTENANGWIGFDVLDFLIKKRSFHGE
jgi:lauroyl/myristoyl acyltransferase